jgi:hypothetical protein
MARASVVAIANYKSVLTGNLEEMALACDLTGSSTPGLLERCLVGLDMPK